MIEKSTSYKNVWVRVGTEESLEMLSEDHEWLCRCDVERKIVVPHVGSGNWECPLADGRVSNGRYFWTIRDRRPQPSSSFIIVFWSCPFCPSFLTLNLQLLLIYIPLFFHMTTSEMWCWSAGRKIWKQLSLCCSIVRRYNGLACYGTLKGFGLKRLWVCFFWCWTNGADALMTSARVRVQMTDPLHSQRARNLTWLR